MSKRPPVSGIKRLKIALVVQGIGLCGWIVGMINPGNINAHSLELLMKIARLIHPSSETRAFTSLPPCKLSENFSNMQAKLLENGACIKLLEPADARVDGNTIINLGRKYAVESRIVQGEPPVRTTIITDITTKNPPPPTVYRTQMYRNIAQ
jgi:hypothetical protein